MPHNMRLYGLGMSVIVETCDCQVTDVTPTENVTATKAFNFLSKMCLFAEVSDEACFNNQC